MGLSNEGRCLTILSITALFGGVGFWGSHATNSYALLGDAAHMIGDGLPFVGTLLLARGTLRKEQEDMVDELIKWANRLFLSGSGLYLLMSGVMRLADPHTVSAGVALFALAELVGNSLQAYLAHTLRHVHNHDTHRSQMIHLFADIAASAGVLVAAVIIALTGWGIVDALVSIVLGPLTIYAITHIEHTEHVEHH